MILIFLHIVLDYLTMKFIVEVGQIRGHLVNVLPDCPVSEVKVYSHLPPLRISECETRKKSPSNSVRNDSASQHNFVLIMTTEESPLLGAQRQPDTNEVQCALPTEDVYNRFSRKQKRVILAIASLSGLLPSMSSILI